MTLSDLPTRTVPALTHDQRRARAAALAAIEGRAPAAPIAGRPAGAKNYKRIQIGRRIYDSRAEAIRGEKIARRTLSYWLATGYAKGIR